MQGGNGAGVKRVHGNYEDVGRTRASQKYETSKKKITTTATTGFKKSKREEKKGLAPETNG
jgi:hypothetical protein